MSSNPSVLYVEDDPQSRKLMHMLLKGRMGLTNINIFEDSTDFLARYQALQSKPDIIFLDIHMKPYDGFEMLEMLRKLDPDSKVPVIALTASVMNEEVHRLRTGGFNGCLAKPIDLTTFPDTLYRIISGEFIWRILD
jgi:CheY-like chemotaxis protein